jgi:hypothetical protein
MLAKRSEAKPGDMITCVLCGGNGFLSEPWEGRDDCKCPCCDGTGRSQYHPLPPSPKDDPRPTDWVCKCGHRSRRADLYCIMCRACRDSKANKAIRREKEEQQTIICGRSPVGGKAKGVKKKD